MKEDLLLPTLGGCFKIGGHNLCGYCQAYDIYIDRMRCTSDAKDLSIPGHALRTLLGLFSPALRRSNWEVLIVDSTFTTIS